ncbi:MAG: DEAD/DEAH box helicase family protein [Deltaproteobacteria bacterium]|nr:DEAD/DEAH box helicase family protein [Deltaproteobacteria bacterium]
MKVVFPAVFVVDEVSSLAHFRKLAERSHSVAGALVAYSRGRLQARLLRPVDGAPEVLILPKGAKPPRDSRYVVASDAVIEGDVWNVSGGRWLRHPEQVPEFDQAADIDVVRSSWVDAFSYVAEDVDRGVVGLRVPQLGALHAAQAHWSVSDGTATIVMPTGTGKTDTMIALLVSARCPRVLVIVPTDALRTQIAEKFLTLGVLKVPASNLLAPTARFPSVTTLNHVPRSLSELNAILRKSHVLITTSHIASLCAEELQPRIAEACPYLFIDEAHHAEAPSWKAFKARFGASRIVQFTATPFREDGRPLDGKIIYKYPLKKAQLEGYFKPIKFAPVTQYNRLKADAAIAERAIEQLRANLGKGHILMARVDTVERARAVYQLYSPFTEFKPVQLHSGVTSAREREQARRQILSGESRIIVCVDMLGEGFDLPELKIAAFHDIRKSLAITLQLAGRFTRARSDLGSR